MNLIKKNKTCILNYYNHITAYLLATIMALLFRCIDIPNYAEKWEMRK